MRINYVHLGKQSNILIIALAFVFAFIVIESYLITKPKIISNNKMKGFRLNGVGQNVKRVLAPVQIQYLSQFILHCSSFSYYSSPIHSRIRSLSLRESFKATPNAKFRYFEAIEGYVGEKLESALDLLVIGTTSTSGPSKTIRKIRKERKRNQDDIRKTKATILLSVSGGSDSMAMLHILQAIKERNVIYKYDLDFEVVNFNHKIREESDEEAIFVYATAQSYGSYCYLKEKGTNFDWYPSLQSKARLWRNRFYNKWIRKKMEKSIEEGDAGHIFLVATGHTLDDSVETILMKLTRGAHITNISPVRFFLLLLLHFFYLILLTFIVTTSKRKKVGKTSNRFNSRAARRLSRS